MSVRIGPPPPEVAPDDAGPWSVVSPVRHAAAMATIARARRRAEPPYGLVTLPAPRVPIPLAGLDPASRVAGVAPLRVIAAARGAVHALTFRDDGATLAAVAPHARRSWEIPTLAAHPEERDGTDPAAGLPGPIEPADLAGALPGATPAPGGEVVAACVRDGRATALALVRLEPRGLVRWVAGARAAAWSADGRLVAIGGDWGVLLAELREG